MKQNLILTAAVILLFLTGTFFGSSLLSWEELTSLSPLAQLRLTRMTGAGIIGGSLALSGLAFQTALRNPLAEPFTLGISSGAATGAALAFLLGLHSLWIYSVPCSAFLGAAAVFMLILGISRRSSSESLLLSGVIVSTIASGLLMFLLSVADCRELAGLTWWMLGDLQGMDPAFLTPAGLLALGTLLLFRYFADDINILALGEEQAHYLGVRPRFILLLLVIPGALLAAGTVSMAGMIGFCGLVIPHIVRRLLGCSQRRILLPVFLSGAAFLMLCDIAGRMVWPEREIPIGVITALIGGPLFLWLLNGRKRYVN